LFFLATISPFVSLTVFLLGHKSFRDFITTLRPEYSLPKSRKTVKKLCLSLANAQTKLIADFFATFERRPACMLDLWKDRMGNHYLGVSLSFMTDSWRIFAITIAMKKFTKTHTAVNIVVRPSFRLSLHSNGKL
jgi:hypothetical protein